MFTERERRYVRSARVARMATVDDRGSPSIIPICFVLIDNAILTPIDEKEQDVQPAELTRVTNIRQHPRVALLIDQYTEEWTNLGWVQISGEASVRGPDHGEHDCRVAALREKYAQYSEHGLDDRPLIAIRPDRVRSWGSLETES
jgi:PPOX class probable F420-dependent enzyme